MYILGIIPARAGSKGIPNKNLHPLNGIPLIQYTIREATKSRLSDLVISTDSARIGQYYKCILRPSNLAQDNTPTLPVIQYTVSEYEHKHGIHIDAVMTLQPTSPLRLADDIDRAIIQYLISGNDSLVSVYEGIHPVKSYNEKGEPFLAQVPYDKHKHKCYTRNGAIFITSRDLLNKGRLIGDKPELSVMPKIRSIDVDDYEDLLIAEAILKKGEIQ